MTILNIWFNQTYSTQYHTVRSVKEAAHKAGVQSIIHTTSDNQFSPVLSAGDIAGIEPARGKLDGEGYIGWMLGYVQTHDIHVIVPTRESYLIAKHREEFEALGCSVVVDSPENIEILEDKELAYIHAEKHGIPTPPWRVVSSGQEFHESLESLEQEIHDKFGRLLTICIKPVDGVGGVGFKRIIRDDRKYAFNELLTGSTDYVRYGEFSDAVSAAGDLGGRYMLMPWLDNPEVSVDILASNGDSRIIIPRAKKSRFEKTIGGEETIASANIARNVVSSLNMSFLSNTQTRLLLGEPVYLETNARMSGGIVVSSLLGIDMCWEAIKVARGHESVEFDGAESGMSYTMVSSPLRAGLDSDI